MSAVRSDTYHKWLGIPSEEQPPTYYRLLGLQPSESDKVVIANAADRQSAYLRQFLDGGRSQEAKYLCDRVERARRCLLDAQKREFYDARLQKASNGNGRARTTQNSAQPSTATAVVDWLFVPCPRCGKEIAYQDSSERGANRVVTCPKCQQNVLTPGKDSHKSPKLVRNAQSTLPDLPELTNHDHEVHSRLKSEPIHQIPRARGGSVDASRSTTRRSNLDLFAQIVLGGVAGIGLAIVILHWLKPDPSPDPSPRGDSGQVSDPIEPPRIRLDDLEVEYEVPYDGMVKLPLNAQAKNWNGPAPAISIDVAPQSDQSEPVGFWRKEDAHVFQFWPDVQDVGTQFEFHATASAEYRGEPITDEKTFAIRVTDRPSDFPGMVKGPLYPRSASRDDLQYFELVAGRGTALNGVKVRANASEVEVIEPIWAERVPRDDLAINSYEVEFADVSANGVTIELPPDKRTGSQPLPSQEEIEIWTAAGVDLAKQAKFTESVAWVHFRLQKPVAVKSVKVIGNQLSGEYVVVLDENEVEKARQPLYRGLQVRTVWGNRTRDVFAGAGFMLHAIDTFGDERLRGIRLIFAPQTDPGDLIYSEWISEPPPDRLWHRLNPQGNKIIGVHGYRDRFGVTSLGLIWSKAKGANRRRPSRDDRDDSDQTGTSTTRTPDLDRDEGYPTTPSPLPAQYPNRNDLSSLRADGPPAQLNQPKGPDSPTPTQATRSYVVDLSEAVIDIPIETESPISIQRLYLNVTGTSGFPGEWQKIPPSGRVAAGQSVVLKSPDESAAQIELQIELRELNGNPVMTVRHYYRRGGERERLSKPILHERLLQVQRRYESNARKLASNQAALPPLVQETNRLRGLLNRLPARHRSRSYVQALLTKAEQRRIAAAKTIAALRKSLPNTKAALEYLNAVNDLANQLHEIATITFEVGVAASDGDKPLSISH